MGFKTYHRMLINGGLAKSTFVGDWWLQSTTIRKSKVMINCYVISSLRIIFSIFGGYLNFHPKNILLFTKCIRVMSILSKTKEEKVISFAKVEKRSSYYQRAHICSATWRKKSFSLHLWGWYGMLARKNGPISGPYPLDFRPPPPL